MQITKEIIRKQNVVFDCPHPTIVEITAKLPVVFDSQSEPGSDISVGLISLLNQCMRKKFAKLTDLYLHNIPLEWTSRELVEVLGVSINPVPSEEWLSFENSFKKLGGVLPEGRPNLVIGLDLSKEFNYEQSSVVVGAF